MVFKTKPLQAAKTDTYGHDFHASWHPIYGSSNGRGSVIPAYYDVELFNILFVEFPPPAEERLLVHNKSLNFIYQSDAGLPGGEPFISVLMLSPAMASTRSGKKFKSRS